jgi:DnaJ-class molecular chaperone
MTHYNTLGVAQDTSTDEIKKSYRKLASVHHPDREGGDTAKFQEIQAAYSILSDATKRAEYDRQLANPNPSGFKFNFNGQDFSGHPSMEEIFRNFGFGFGGDPFSQFRQANQPRRNRDIQLTIPMPLVSTLDVQKRTLSFQTTNGHSETVEVTIPRGISNNSTIKYPGLGDNFFATLPRGDLYINLLVDPHPDFQVNGIDLYTTKSIDCLTAIVGGQLEIQGIDGKLFSILIPAGCQHDTGFRIPDQGLWLMDSLTRGNLIVKIHVTVPTNLSKEQIFLINQVRENLKSNI